MLNLEPRSALGYLLASSAGIYSSAGAASVKYLLVPTAFKAITPVLPSGSLASASSWLVELDAMLA